MMDYITLTTRRANTLADTCPLADTSELEHQIAELVCQLYGLTEKDVKVVEGR